MRMLAATAALGAVLVCSYSPAAGATGFSAQAGAFVDDGDGSSYDASLQFRPVEWLTLSAGGGHSSTSSDATEFDGSSVHGGVALQRDHFGAALRASQWQDSDQFRSAVLGGELSWTFAESLEAALLLESRRLEVDYAVTGPLGRVLPQSASFEGKGVGARIGWYGDTWSAWASGTSYDYDARLDRLVTASRAASTARFPRIAALVNSVLTRTAGAIDYQASVGLERALARAGLGAELSLSSDALSGADSVSYSLTGRYELTTHWSADATLGMTDTDGFDAVGFAGLGVSYRN